LRKLRQNVQFDVARFDHRDRAYYDLYGFDSKALAARASVHGISKTRKVENLYSDNLQFCNDTAVKFYSRS